MTDRYPSRHWHTRSAEETQATAAELLPLLDRGSVVAFRGDLGTGKTCMIQGLCRALEVDEYVTSPTFILINEYTGRLRGTPVDLYHFDLYRLGSLEELEDLGAEEYFYGQGICLIEWPERAGPLLPSRRLEIALQYEGSDGRRITLTDRRS